jgi:hypothetical protein
LLALLGAHHILHVSRIRVKLVVIWNVMSCVWVKLVVIWNVMPCVLLPAFLEGLAVTIFRVEVKIETVQSSTMYNYFPDIYDSVFRVDVKLRQHISPKYL